jgi:penicillin-binding protein 1A
MMENGYITRDQYELAKEEPLRTVQSGDYEGFKAQLPDRDYFTDEIRRQLSRDFGEDEFFSGGMAVRATVDPEMQVEAADALQRGLEAYDRNIGIWRPTGKTLPQEVLINEVTWREALSNIDISRDISLDNKWYPAVVLGVSGDSARLGIEGVPDPEAGGVIEANDVTWARRQNADGSTSGQARVPADLLKVGEVVHVRRMTADGDGSFVRWTLRQVPEVQGGFMAMDVNTGRVLAMQGGFSYQHSVFNRATQAKRQPGSSFKPFVYAAALDSGYSPATIVVDSAFEKETPEGLWQPKNASNKFTGPKPLRKGIEQSNNIMTIRLANEIGMDVVSDYAERFGIYRPGEMRRYLANALGSEETTLFNVAAAYAMFANGGERVEPTLVDRVQDRFGRTVYKHDQRVCEDCQFATLEAGFAPRITSNRERVLDPITAYQLTSMLSGVVERGTARSTVNLSVPVAGKTGTTNNAKDVWFVGFTSNIVAGCYIGHDTPRGLGRGASGGGMCGPVFNQFMTKAVEKYGGGAFDVPSGCQFLNIDGETGARMPQDATGDRVIAECFRQGDEPQFGVTLDGGFAIGSDLPISDEATEATDLEVTTSSGQKARVAPNASFGSLSSGGLY